MSEEFDREAFEAEMREFHWREEQVQRELTEALHHYLHLLWPEQDRDEHAAWLSLLAERTYACMTMFLAGNHPWYDFESAPEALKLALCRRPDARGPFRRLTIEHEPSCVGYVVALPEGEWVRFGYCQCHLRVRRDT